MAHGKYRLSFRGNYPTVKESELGFLHKLVGDDLLEYGLIPEMVGRLPVVTCLGNLDKASLIKVLTEPKNALAKQYQEFLSMDNVDLVFTSDALEMAAEEALNRKTGARGLRSIIEECLLDAMYDLPSLKEVVQCVIDGNIIKGNKPPMLLTAMGVPVNLPGYQQRLA